MAEDDKRLDITDEAPVAGDDRNILGKVTRAVALGYDSSADPAPRIVASGKGAVAEQILQLAFAHNIKVREDADLVEILSVLEVDSLIPLEAYVAVAEILRYVYQASGQSRGA
jgi:flagellar biosynthesis protein